MDGTPTAINNSDVSVMVQWASPKVRQLSINHKGTYTGNNTGVTILFVLAFQQNYICQLNTGYMYTK